MLDENDPYLEVYPLVSGLVEPHNWTTHTRHFPPPCHWGLLLPFGHKVGQPAFEGLCRGSFSLG